MRRNNFYTLFLLFFLGACTSTQGINRDSISLTLQPTLQKSLPSSTPTINPTQLVIVEPQKGMEQGNMLVKAIEDYHKDKDKYPETLSDLVPDYINEIPVTITGKSYQFTLSNLDIYVLFFSLQTKEDVKGYCSYIKKYQDWECGVYAEH